MLHFTWAYFITELNNARCVNIARPFTFQQNFSVSYFHSVNFYVSWLFSPTRITTHDTFEQTSTRAFEHSGFILRLIVDGDKIKYEPSFKDFEVVLMNVYEVMLKSVNIVPRVETKLYSDWVSDLAYFENGTSWYWMGVILNGVILKGGDIEGGMIVKGGGVILKGVILQGGWYWRGGGWYWRGGGVILKGVILKGGGWYWGGL